VCINRGDKAISAANGTAALDIHVAHAVEELEDSALIIRTNIAEYLDSMDGCIASLRQFWLHHHNHCHIVPNAKSSSSSEELRHAGRQMALQLIQQIRWDERLLNEILKFLDEGLYDINGSISDNKSKSNINTTRDLLRAWEDAMSNMLEIDKSFWIMVQDEVYIELLTDSEKPMQQAEDIIERDRGTFVILPIGPSILLDSEMRNDKNNLEANTTTATAGLTSIENRVTGIHHRIVSSTTVEEAIEIFAETDGRNDQERTNCATSSFTSILLLGEEGCGKTHFLDTIQQRYASVSTLNTLRPNYTEDLMGNSIGSTEDRLIALFTHASQIKHPVSEEEDYDDNVDGTGMKCIIMLDDVDQMFSISNDGIDNESLARTNVGSNCKALFITILDAFRNRVWRPSSGGGNNVHVLLLCTSRSKCSEIADRFDRIFQRGLPDEARRRDLILSCLSIGITACGYNASDIDDDTIDAILSPIVHHAAGKLDCELAQYCREVLLNCVHQTKSRSGQIMESMGNIIIKERLCYLDRILQTKTPQSLRGGSLDGIVDMRVYTPDELQSKLVVDTNGNVQLPLLGYAAKRAYEELINVVITPLCRSDEIRALLYGGEGGCGEEVGIHRQTIRVGALLAGGPGVGKTSLVYHCAALAAKMSRVSLLEVSATSLIHKELGGSERAVRRLFTAVRAAAPCILLIDGIESVAPKRGNDNTSEGTMDRVLSTFLTEMDGIESGGVADDGSSPSNIGVIGITHNPQLIDPALLRPGRLEKTIQLGAPDYEARKEIAARQLEEIDFDFTQAGCFDAKSKDDVSKYVAMESAGMSAVEVIAICREASMVCLRELNFEVTTKPLLTHAHFKVAASIMKGKAGG
jgi:SpoVK/Ycf46/Vps4 family AAA+-type ATPase